MAVSSEGRMALYMQEIKREHKHLMRKSEELTLSLNKIDTLYQAMQEQELKMKEMDEKVMALVEDGDDMMESFRQMKSDSYVQIEKIGTGLQSLALKVARLDARESEHSMRFDNNVPLLRDIQKRLGQLENMADHSAKSKGKATKQPENQNVDHLMEHIVSMRTSIQEQESSLMNLRGELDQVKHKARQAVRRVSEMTTQAEGQAVDDLAPLKTTPKRSTKNRQGSHLEYLRITRN
ncbi:hypothetical protein SLS56_000793 [Neofusicoccum ribis]|uniref:Uncharacterized protein n=1 Tax=Neofusicoccum ribis TaxID=45134 RepID=A0ABR3TC83_9PEZI